MAKNANLQVDTSFPKLEISQVQNERESWNLAKYCSSNLSIISWHFGNFDVFVQNLTKHLKKIVLRPLEQPPFIEVFCTGQRMYIQKNIYKSEKDE